MRLYIRKPSRFFLIIGIVSIIVIFWSWATWEYVKNSNWHYSFFSAFVTYHLIKRYFDISNTIKFVEINNEEIVIPSKTRFSQSAYVKISKNELLSVRKIRMLGVSGILLRKKYMLFFINRHDFLKADYINLRKALDEYGYFNEVNRS